MSSEIHARIELARKYMSYFVSLVTPNYMFNWFNKDLCARLDRFEREVEEGLAPCLMINVPPRHGKDLFLGTPLLTTQGWKTMEKVEVGDYVYAPDGTPVKVLGKSEVFKQQQMYMFCVGHERNVLCGPNHEWPVEINDHTGVYPAAALHAMQNKALIRALPVAPLVGHSSEPLLIDPYVLGFWLGDGYSNSSRIAQLGDDHAELCELFKERGIEFSVDGSNTAVTVTGLVTKLRELKLYKNKHIPEVYKYAPLRDRYDLIRGLVDSDGYVGVNGKVEIAFGKVDSADKLIDDTIELLRSVGVFPKLYVDNRHARRLTFWAPEVGVAYNYRKSERMKLRGKPKATDRTVSISRAGFGDTQCIEVEGGLYLAGKGLLPTHNSELGSRCFPAHLFGKHPRYQVISATHSAPLALENSRDVLRIMREPIYREIFPETRLDSKNNAATGWRTTMGGRYKPAGAGQGISGYGANLLLIDDPHKDTEAYSEAVCDALWRWYLSSAVTRLMPSAGQLVIQTRWTLFDLCGRLLEDQGRIDEGGKWEVVTYPAIAVHDEYRNPVTGVISYQPVEGYELMRKAGEPLHKERYSLLTLLDTQARDPVVWNALYQQDPLAADVTLFTDLEKTKCSTDDIPPLDELVTYSTWDLASGQKDMAKSAYSADVTVGVDKSGTLWVLEVNRVRDDMFDIAERMLNQYEEYNYDIVGVEEMQAATALMPFLERMAADRGINNLPVTLLKTRTLDKVARAGPIQALIRQGKVRIPDDTEWYKDFISELRAFPNGRYKDMVDAFAWMGQIMTNLVYYSRARNKPANANSVRRPFAEPKRTRFKNNKRWKTA